MQTASLKPNQIAPLMKKAMHTGAYFRSLSGRIHQHRFPHSDPLKIAADEMLVAAEQYETRLKEIGRQCGVENPWDVTSEKSSG